MKDTINLNLTYQEQKLIQQYEIIHYDDVNFMKYFTLSFGIGGNLNINSDSTTIGIILNLTGKIEF